MALTLVGPARVGGGGGMGGLYPAGALCLPFELVDHWCMHRAGPGGPL